jgi:hypothetical protein
VLVITRLSRAVRSLKHQIHLAEELRTRGVRLVVLKQQIDTTTPAGRPVFHILRGIDESQRELTAEGTREGLHAARGPWLLRGPPAEAERRQGRHRAAQVPGHRTGREEAAHRRRDRPDRGSPPRHRARLPQQGGLTCPPARRTRPGTPGRSSPGAAPPGHRHRRGTRAACRRRRPGGAPGQRPLPAVPPAPARYRHRQRAAVLTRHRPPSSYRAGDTFFKERPGATLPLAAAAGISGLHPGPRQCRAESDLVHR